MTHSKNPPDLQTVLERLAAKLIEATLAASSDDIVEGHVQTTGPAPYRRLDCGGRALAYIRARPRKKAVRVDVTGLWRTPASRLQLPNAGGAASLLLKSEVEVYEAVRFLVSTVERTRRHEAKLAS